MRQRKISHYTSRLCTKNDYYYMVFRIPGRDNEKWEATHLKATKSNKVQAREMMNRRLDEIKNQYRDMDGSCKSISFDNLINNVYLPTKKSTVKASTYDDYVKKLAHVAVPYFAGKNVDEITYEDIILFFDELREKGRKGTTIRKYKVLLSSAIDMAVDRGYIGKNPMEKRKFNIPDSEFFVKYHNDEFYESILSCFKDNEDLYLMIQIFTIYGIRRSELVGLKWENINFKDKIIHVIEKVTYVTKDGKKQFILNEGMKTTASRRSFPIDDEIIDLLLKRKERTEQYKKLYGDMYFYGHEKYVFTKENGELYKPDNISDIFRRTLEKNNIEKIRLHDLRHFTASKLVEKKVPMSEIKNYMGHSSIKTTDEFYAHLSDVVNINNGKIMAEEMHHLSNPKD